MQRATMSKRSRKPSLKVRENLETEDHLQEAEEHLQELEKRLRLDKAKELQVDKRRYFAI